MKRYFLHFLLAFILVACSTDETVNNQPSEFALEDLSLNGTSLNLSWTAATDADDDKIYYNVYLNSELIAGPITRNNLVTTLEYNKDYEGVIIATDRKGGNSQLTFNFRSLTSKIALVGDFESGNLLAIDLHTQRTLWEAPSMDRIHSVNNGQVFTGFKKLSAYKIITGEKVWEAKPVGQFDLGYRHLMADDQFLYAKTSDARLFSIDLNRQEKQWEIGLFEINYLFAMDGDNLYIPKRNNEDLISINKNSGETNWGYSLNETIGSFRSIKHAPLVYNGNLYFQDHIGHFYSLNKHTGEKNYSIFIGKSSETAPVGVNDNIIFTAGDEIISLKSNTGHINWRYNFGANSRSSPFEKEGYIYVGAGENLFCLDALTGNLEWKTNLGGEIVSSPVVYDQKVYISSHSASLYCVNANSGTIDYKIGNINFSVSSPTLVIGDTEEIIYPSNSGYHYYR